MCAEGGGQGSAENGLVLMEKSLSIKVDCTNGWHTGSNVYLYNANGGPWGFPLKLDTGNDETLSQRSLGNGWYSGPTNEVTTFVGKATSVWYSSIKQRGGYYLADEALMWYLSAGTLATKNTITILVEVGQYYLDPPGAVEIAVATYVTQRDDVWSAADWLLFMDESGCGDTVTADDLAWGGNLQYTNTYCGLGEVFAGQEVWTMGYFIPCEFEMSTEIFFPYLPRLTGTDYWTGIALVNHGGFDFPADGGLVGHIYEADGNHWTVEFPALPKQNMQTWLIADGPSGVGFSGATADPLTEGLFLTPETDGNDLSFGDVRFNMFVVGSYMTTSSAMNRSSFQPGDLDGYCLIGLGTSIDGAYLARNMEGVFDTGIDVPPAPNYKSVITLKSDEEVMAIISSAKKMKAELDK